jgi:hypothetical protein
MDSFDSTDSIDTRPFATRRPAARVRVVSGAGPVRGVAEGGGDSVRRRANGPPPPPRAHAPASRSRGA